MRWYNTCLRICDELLDTFWCNIFQFCLIPSCMLRISPSSRSWPHRHSTRTFEQVCWVLFPLVQPNKSVNQSISNFLTSWKFHVIYRVYKLYFFNVSSKMTDSNRGKVLFVGDGGVSGLTGRPPYARIYYVTFSICAMQIIIIQPVIYYYGSLTGYAWAEEL